MRAEWQCSKCAAWMPSYCARRLRSGAAREAGRGTICGTCLTQACRAVGRGNVSLA